MAMSGSGLANKIVDDLVSAGKLDGLSASDITKLKDDMTITYTSVIDYIIANMEINGLEISEPLETIETYAAGVGTNGGTLTGQIPINGNVVQAAKTRTQSNGGTGLIS